MSTIVKTGVVLQKLNEPTVAYLFQKTVPQDGFHKINTVYGDLHIVGNCCVLYYPSIQVHWGTSHGWIDLTDPHIENFQRDGADQSILVIPARMIRLRRDALHPIDLSKFVGAGGVVEDMRGEMG